MVANEFSQPVVLLLLCGGMTEILAFVNFGQAFFDPQPIDERQPKGIVIENAMQVCPPHAPVTTDGTIKALRRISRTLRNLKERHCIVA